MMETSARLQLRCRAAEDGVAVSWITQTATGASLRDASALTRLATFFAKAGSTVLSVFKGQFAKTEDGTRIARAASAQRPSLPK